MADLGTIGRKTRASIMVPMPSAGALNITNNPVTGSLGNKAIPKREDWKSLSGIIRNKFLEPVSRSFSVMRRADSVEVARGTSASDGTFSVKVPAADPVFIVAFDTNGDNAIIVDNVVPI